MSEPNPPRRPLATFLRPAPEGEAAPATDARTPDPALHGIPAAETGDPIDAAVPPMAETRQSDDTVILDEAAVIEPVLAAPAAQAVAGDAPSFLGTSRPRALPTPHWHWVLVAGLALLLVLQSVLADRARLAADASNRAWLGALCGALRCSLPA